MHLESSIFLYGSLDEYLAFGFHFSTMYLCILSFSWNVCVYVCMYTCMFIHVHVWVHVHVFLTVDSTIAFNFKNDFLC